MSTKTRTPRKWSLKTCPFCGGKAASHTREPMTGTFMAFVQCWACGAVSPVAWSAQAILATRTAVGSWNLRQPKAGSTS